MQLRNRAHSESGIAFSQFNHFWLQLLIAVCCMMGGIPVDAGEEESIRHSFLGVGKANRAV
ncbi:MAG: hypothetical protein RLN85_11620, partial [Pseudomonadales bacterium]